MSTRSTLRFLAILLTVLLCSCEDSTNCPCSSNGTSTPLSYISVTWLDGNIGANLMPPVLPDPITLQARLVLENRHRSVAFTNVDIPSADVTLADNDSLLGTIPIETDWDGDLGPAERDTVFVLKTAGTVRIFDPPCSQRVLVDFTIQDSNGDVMIFRPDTLTFNCVH